MDASASGRFAGLSGDLKPREMMERAADPASVPDAALLAIILKTGAAGMDVCTLAQRLIEAFGSVKAAISADWRSLEARIAEFNRRNPDRRIKGIGHVKCLELAAAFEIGRRWARMTPEEIRSFKVGAPEDAYRVFKTVFDPGDDRENLFALLLDARLHPLCEPLRISRGTGDSAPAFARDVYREALKWGASGVMVAHNHPGGELRPSACDWQFTADLIAIGKIARIALLDHLIIGPEDALSPGYISLRTMDKARFQTSAAFTSAR